MRVISGKYVGELNVKCINCNSYYNYDELLKRDNSKPLNGADGRTMDDLISREEAISTIKSMLYQTALNSVEGDEKAALLYGDIADNRVEIWLKLVDSVSAVPVVRCRDCKYYAINRLTKAYEPDKRFNPSVCIIGEFAKPRKPDWFCADGERRDSE